MKKVNFTNMYLENFGRFTEPIQHKLGHRTLISGANGVGKSTIKRMIMYVLGTKDENGKVISGIRPHDENGVDIDGLTTTAELTVSVDGLENTLKRTCFQEKNRQGEYTSKDNLQYFVDDVKKGTKKAYDDFVHTIIPDTVCISAQELLIKDTAGRRAMLEVFSKHDTNSIVDENHDFEPLRAKLKANTVTDLKKACRDKIKVKTKERDAYPARIDEIEKQKVDIDLAELELHRNALNEQIAEVKEKQANVDKQFEEYDKLTDGIMKLKFELNDLQRKENEELVKQKRDLQSQIDDKTKYVEKLIKTISANIKFIANYKEEIEKSEKEIKSILEQWENVNVEVFDENIAICPTCHREFPPEEREKLLKDFEKSKEERIAKINENGSKEKKNIKDANSMIKQLEKLNEEYGKGKEKAKGELEQLEKQLFALPDSIDISDRPEVQEIQRQIAEKEQAMSKGNRAKEIRQRLREEYEDLQRRLNEVQKQFNKAEENNRIDERIEELRQKQRNLSQEIAEIEKELDLLQIFERKKAELLESDINSNFNIIQWHMFKKMQNGDLADICSPFVNGTSYDGNLNKGARILAQLDICLSFQKLYDVQMPVLLDDGESIDSWRIPQVANQIIIFKRTDDKELKIECLED